MTPAEDGDSKLTYLIVQLLNRPCDSGAGDKQMWSQRRVSIHPQMWPRTAEVAAAQDDQCSCYLYWPAQCLARGHLQWVWSILTFNKVLCVCVSACVFQALTEARRGYQSPGAAATGRCEPQLQVPGIKSSQGFNHWVLSPEPPIVSYWHDSMLAFINQRIKRGK